MLNFLNKILLNNYFLVLVTLLCIFKIIFYFFIPLNILGNAPHDDFLFYRLGKSITEFNWLGTYDPLTLIKGPIYSFFLSLSMFFQIPLRIVEALFSIIASLYFLLSTSKIFNTTYSRIFIFILINFFPFVFTATEYRLLRDSIYIYLLLFILSDILFILLNTKLKAFYIRFY